MIVHNKTADYQLASSPLLVLSPNHGRVVYKWEWKSVYDEQWQLLDVPMYTCLLYPQRSGQYKCTVGSFETLFTVKGEIILLIMNVSACKQPVALISKCTKCYHTQ